MLLAFLGGARLVDVDAVNDRASVTSNSKLTICQRNFRTNVIERDGTCVITDDLEEYCTACHILPHAKGSNVCPYKSSMATF